MVGEKGREDKCLYTKVHASCNILSPSHLIAVCLADHLVLKYELYNLLSICHLDNCHTTLLVSLFTRPVY
jgi:hypothetical protein